MEVVVRPVEQSDDELKLFPDWAQDREHSGRFRIAAAISLGIHVVVIAVLMSAPVRVGPDQDAARILASLRNPTKLVAPPPELTQKAPNHGKVSKEFELEDLLPRPRVWIPPSAPSTTRPAAPLPGTPVPAPPALSEPPKIDEPESTGLNQPPVVAQRPKAPPPQIQPDEKPRLAFENPRKSESGQGALRPPAGSVSEIAREMARGGGMGGLVVGDVGMGVGGLGEGLNLPPSPGKSGSTLELLSDPRGVDFRPYLVTVLSAVRRNWFAVIPESVRYGRRGKVIIQFAISRDGKVPKLVIASPSGADALDRAAVAGISASNPFPPLPSEFRGEQVRLQFVFLYNMKN